VAIFASLSLVRLIIIGVAIGNYYGGITVFQLFTFLGNFQAIVLKIIFALYLVYTILFFLILNRTHNYISYQRALRFLFIFGTCILAMGAISEFIDRRKFEIGVNPLEIFWVPLSIVVPVFQTFAYGSYLPGFIANVITTVLQGVVLASLIVLRNNKEQPERGTNNMLPNNSMWTVRIPGQPETPVDSATLQNWVKTGFIKRNTMITEVSSGYSYQASQVPGLFSSKSYVTALLLSFFFGVFGVDRFYLGHVGVGLGKLFTLGGLGIWALIDFILIATKNVKDAEGMPLI
jgi:hypothetical protein